MNQIISFSTVGNKILTDIRGFMDGIRDIVKQEVHSVSEGVTTLQKLRQAAYEEINQIQHEEMVFRAACSLRDANWSAQDIKWYWNPRQTGDNSEPDLRAIQNDRIVLSAEVTTSDYPKGIIDSRMRDTLVKLSKMLGQKYYFVRTEAMEKRAKTKVSKSGYSIDVRCI